MMSGAHQVIFVRICQFSDFGVFQRNPDKPDIRPGLYLLEPSDRCVRSLPEPLVDGDDLALEFGNWTNHIDFSTAGGKDRSTI